MNLQEKIDELKGFPVPIVRITNEYGIATYKEDMENGVLSKMYIDGTTEDIYDGNNKVISVNRSLHEYKQRLILARQFMYYLIEVRSDPNYVNDKILKKNEYSDDEYKKSIISVNPNDIYFNMGLQLLLPDNAAMHWYLHSLQFGRESSAMYLSTLFEIPEDVAVKKISLFRSRP